ncbi:MAG: type II secretion system F family protein [Liquorilactobacillus nagelii]|uniref:type II secretion system F family protein n=1 Tax=Liquorilactobacillus nagelii TaxID=82688 RepID=UPI0024328EDD|nr:type II secretion system F family protein [Liquorilactobacillus nagelii]MCI1634259.1 type II secretion system F family protein [Liquorilactobacillus nagelii]MCI1921292.1 type II secretion system F family protein [Liquorilactobacillus nagelii]MCI1977300.1 type II secretion system F family protein [Liquorilactobacillus nagelii]
MKNVFRVTGSLCQLKKFLRPDRNEHWSIRQQTEFFQTYYVLLREGFSLKQIAADLPVLYPQDREKFLKIYDCLNKGQTLSNSLRPYISQDVANQLWIAESHGMLLTCLKQLARFYTQKRQQLEHLKAVLLYPIILVAMMLFLLFSITFYLKPELQLIQTTSVPTNRIILRIKKISIILMSIILLSFIRYLWNIKKLFKKQHYLSRWDWFCDIPVFSKIFRTYAYYYLAFNLGLLLKGGLDLQSICNLLVRFDHRSLLYQFNLSLHNLSISGQELSVLADQKKYIPPEFRLFFSKGSTLENLSNELLFYANLTYGRLLFQLNRLIELIQPIMFVVIGIVIVLTYLSILLPMYQNLGGINYDNG